MIAENDEYMTEAANNLIRLSGDHMTRKIAQEREDYYREQRTWKHRLAQQEAALAKQQTALHEKDSIIAEKDTALGEKDTLIAELQAQLAAMQPK